MSPATKRAVLLGAGHAHLYTIQRAAVFRRQGYELVLIAPGPFWYSGLATGMLGGAYAPAQDQIDVAALVQAGGGRFVPGRAARIDPARRTLTLESGEEITYDVLSVNVGSEAVILPGAGGLPNVYGLKPLDELWRLRRDLEAVGTAARRVVIVGGGASGGEIAMNVRACLDRVGAKGSSITLLAAGERIFEQFAPAAASKAAWLLERRGVEICLRARVAGLQPGEVWTEAGDRLPFDFLVNAAGLRPPAFLRESGLATDDRGAVSVNRCLQVGEHPSIFGGGDCVAFEARPLARIGVYAVRAAPVLCHNLLAFLRDGRVAKLRPFRPQRSFLLILNAGGGEALAVWRRFYWHGRAAFRLKDFLDRRFLAASQRVVGA